MKAHEYKITKELIVGNLEISLVLKFNNQDKITISITPKKQGSFYFNCDLDIVESNSNLDRLVFISRDTKGTILACLSLVNSFDEHLFYISYMDREGVVFQLNFKDTYRKLTNKTQGSLKDFIDINYFKKEIEEA